MRSMTVGVMISKEPLAFRTSRAPGQGLLLTAQDIVLVAVSLLWCGGVTVWKTVPATRLSRSLGQLLVFGAAITRMFVSDACTAAWADAQINPITLVTIADARSGIHQTIGQSGSPGAILVFAQPLLDGNYKPIGTNSGFCIRTSGNYSECQWALTFMNGSTITVAGQESDSGTSIIPIIGGSGDYLLVGGVMASTPNGNKTFTQVLTLYLRQ